MAKTNAMQRSLKYLKDNGWQVARVERWQMRPQAKFGVRIDVWGFGDILACRYQDGHMVGQLALIQTFPMSGWRDHYEKMMSIPELQYWKTCGGTVLMHGWALKAKGGVRGAKKVWTLREEKL